MRAVEIDSLDHLGCAIRIEKRSNITVRNVNINHAGVGICVFDSENIKIENVRMVNTISVAGPHCKWGLTVEQCKFTHRRKNPEKLYPVNTHNNLWVQSSSNVAVDSVYLEKGETGLYAYKVDNLRISNLYCRDIRGPFWRGQCVQFHQSDGASLKNFYTLQLLESSSGHDNINAFESRDVVVENGLIDGNWSRNGVGVIADTGAHNMTVRDVDITRNGVAGVNVWSGSTNKDNGNIGINFRVENVRVRDGHCDTSWYNKPELGPSSKGLAFAAHPSASGARYIDFALLESLPR